MHILTRTVAALLLPVALVAPAAAEEKDADWFSVVGDFVQAGLGPARTIEDIRREEQRKFEATLRSDGATDEGDVEVKAGAVEDSDAEAENDAETVSSPGAAPVVSDVVSPAQTLGPAQGASAQPPAQLAPGRAPVQAALPVPAAAPVAATPAAVAPAVEPVARPLPRPAAATMPVPAPRPTVTARAEPAPPEPPVSRIAATATVDQALKLGGATDTYDRRLVVPASN